MLLFQLQDPDVFRSRYMTKLIELLQQPVLALSKRLFCSKIFAIANFILLSVMQHSAQMAQKFV